MAKAGLFKSDTETQFMRTLAGSGDGAKGVVREELARIKNGETTNEISAKFQYDPSYNEGIRITKDVLMQSIMEVMVGIPDGEAQKLTSLLYDRLEKKG